MPPAAPSTTTRRARRLVALVAVGALASIAATCQSAKPPAPQPPPLPTQYCAPSTPDAPLEYQSAFDNLFATNTAGWVASDGGLPIPLNDGTDRILWLFGDTIIGRLGAGANGAASSERLASNGFVVQSGNCFRPMTDLVPRTGNQWFWPTGAAMAPGNVLYIFGFRMRPKPEVPDFPFELVHMEVAKFSLPNLTSLGRQTLPHTSSTQPTYGETVLVGADGLLYLYGHKKSGLVGHHYIAKVSLDQLFDGTAWEFWKDDIPLVAGDVTEEWVPGAPGEADEIVFNYQTGPPTVDGPAAGIYMAHNTIGTGLLGSAFRVDALDKRFIETWAAAEPQGPFTLAPVPAFDIRTAHGGLNDAQKSYGGRVVFDVLGGPIVQWSINHNSFDAILANPGLYKVWFRAPKAGSIPGPP
jgi:hypothetical protein